MGDVSPGSVPRSYVNGFGCMNELNTAGSTFIPSCGLTPVSAPIACQLFGGITGRSCGAGTQAGLPKAANAPLAVGCLTSLTGVPTPRSACLAGVAFHGASPPLACLRGLGEGSGEPTTLGPRCTMVLGVQGSTGAKGLLSLYPYRDPCPSSSLERLFRQQTSESSC